MCRPAHVSGSVAGLSPCHGLPLPTGWALLITISAVSTRLPIPTWGSRVPPACCSRLPAPSPAALVAVHALPSEAREVLF